MVFFGLPIKLTLHPALGQPYKNAWRDTCWHPYILQMGLWYFQQIRSMLHLNDNSQIGTLVDSLFKVLLLLNQVKVTFANYLKIGSKVVLDNAHVASWSKYVGFSFFFFSTQ